MPTLRQILAEEGLRRTAIDPDEWGALQAANQLAKKLDLPVVFRDWKTQEISVPVPRGTDSLFKELNVVLRVQGKWGRIGWSYVHPNNNGSNGLTVGQVGFNEKLGQWFWRVDGTNDHGTIPKLARTDSIPERRAIRAGLKGAASMAKHIRALQRMFPKSMVKSTEEGGWGSGGIWTGFGEDGTSNYNRAGWPDEHHPKLTAYMDKHGLWAEWNDPGTLMIYS